MNGRSALRRRGSALDCSAIEEEETIIIIIIIIIIIRRRRRRRRRRGRRNFSQSLAVYHKLYVTGRVSKSRLLSVLHGNQKIIRVQMLYPGNVNTHCQIATNNIF
jgi:hypothetical protein